MGGKILVVLFKCVDFFLGGVCCYEGIVKLFNIFVNLRSINVFLSYYINFWFFFRLSGLEWIIGGFIKSKVVFFN